MLKWKVLGGAVAVLSVGVLGVTLLPATGQVGGKRFVLCEKDGRFDTDRDIDNGPNGFSSGDVFVFTEAEFDESGDRVGTLVGTGTVVRSFNRAEDAFVNFNVSLNLEGGRIEIQASSKFTNLNRAHLAIVGGTGKFAGKTGTVTPKARSCNGVAKEGRGDSLVVRFD
jgi:hypothetical protein